MANVNLSFNPQDENGPSSFELIPMDGEDAHNDVENRIEKWILPTTGNDIVLHSFVGTVHEDSTYFVSTVSIPNYFNEIIHKNKNPNKKYRYEGLFLLQTSDPNALIPSSSDRGGWLCIPQLALWDDKKVGPPCFSFGELDDEGLGKSKFFPVVIPNWQVIFHVSEDLRPWYYRDRKTLSEPNNWKRRFDPKTMEVSGDSPAYYDPTLGVIITRQVSLVDKVTGERTFRG